MPDTDPSHYSNLLEQPDDVLFSRLSRSARSHRPSDATQTVATAQGSELGAPSVGLFADRKRMDPAAIAQVMSNLSQPNVSGRPLWNEISPHLDDWSQEVASWRGERRENKDFDH